ncbi:hypothetical protein M9H77_23604 [Catharanthus roseus]|uniref:Uncharacterized protein n=1 Tax=Catharanthus roseus TaxID=4058 RepID=A0ACC0AUI6_CATRO|nr:hypothetical protein M9H77_23604 [Catharanthus roseus]
MKRKPTHRLMPRLGLSMLTIPRILMSPPSLFMNGNSKTLLEELLGMSHRKHMRMLKPTAVTSSASSSSLWLAHSVLHNIRMPRLISRVRSFERPVPELEEYERKARRIQSRYPYGGTNSKGGFFHI